MRKYASRPGRQWQRKLNLAAATLLVLASLSAGYPTGSAPAASQILYLPLITRASAVSQVYWGAMVDGQPPTTANLQPGGVYADFEARVGRQMSILHWGQPWQMNGSYVSFQTEYFNNTRNHGSIPLLDWGSFLLGGGLVQPAFQLSAISAGQQDAYIRQWALDAKAWGHPFFLRFDPEMNGNWNLWSEQVNGNGAGQFAAMWRHVHDIFTSVGAANVNWVWCPNIDSSTMTPLADLYPGDAYVDWTCLDGYNKYPVWLGFSSIFSASGINWLADSYHEMLALAPDKPLMIGEISSLEAGDGGALKAAWITDALSTQLPNNFPKIRAVVWFDWDANSADWATLPIESSPASQAAFAAAISASYYAGNNFAGLDTALIAPLP